MHPLIRATIVILSLTLPLLLLCGEPANTASPAPLSPEPAAPAAFQPSARRVIPPVKSQPATAPPKRIFSNLKGNDLPVVPPGMVPFKGGRTKVGSNTKEIQKILDEDPSLLGRVSSLDAETPQHSVTVAPFNMMLTEVTNEQYREFVKATGHQPPQVWGEDVIEEARSAFLKSEGARQKEAREKKISFEAQKFNRKEFWKDNWEGKTWEVKDKDLMTPVVYIDYADALAYCQWAGLRLPTEDEFQHACRLKGAAPYPWGAEATPTKFAITAEFTGIKAPMPVALLPGGKSPSGLYDLIGNAWEWTSNPYVEYKGWKQHTYTTGTSKKNRRKQKSDPVWNGDRRVSVGGSYQLPISANRCTIRRGTERSQKTSAVSFRAAASENPVSDQSNSLYRSKVRLSPARGDGVTFNNDLAFGWIHWESREGELSPGQTKTLLKAIRRIKPVQTEYAVPEGYRVITGYKYFIFTPVEIIESTSDKGLQRSSLHTPVQLGYISFEQDMVSPALTAGSYIVAYRHKGEHPGPTSEEAKQAKNDKVEFEMPAYLSTINVETANILFFEATSGELAAHVPVTKSPRIAGGEAGGELTSYMEKLRIKGPDGKPAFKEETRLRVSMRLAGKASRRACSFEFDIMPAEGFVDQNWIR
ncbi:MAG: formylglycine-generating enzyme family protein [bacterium]|nr:formylglycine-generating enzyme family protein [bacterium]